MAVMLEAFFPDSPRSAALLVGALLFIYNILFALYRLTLHPLAGLPGPFFARISGWYPTISSAQGRRYLDQYDCHQRYGTVVRWAPDYVIFNTTTAIQTIYGDSRRNNVRKDDLYNFFDDPKDRSSTITTLEKGTQGRKRRILSHAFSPQALQGADELICTAVGKWRDLIGNQVTGSEWSTSINIHEYCDWFTMDAAAALTFGKSFNLIESEEYRFMPSWITSSFRLLTIIGHSPVLPYWPLLKRLRLNLILDYDGWSRRPKFVSIVNGLMVERQNMEEDQEESIRKDFYHWIRHASDSETKEPYSLPEVLTECAMLMNGGTGGPSTMLTGCFFYLSAYPDVLKRVTAEIRRKFKSGDQVKAGLDLNSCTYLQAVLSEAARLSTAHPGTLPRRVMKGGQAVDGVFLPENTVVGVAAWAVHHNEEYFPDPTSFEPERWIVNDAKGNTSEAVAQAKNALFSFSAGGNNCIGKPTAYQMLGMALARILWEFDIRRSPGNLETAKELPFEDMFSAKAPAVMIQFKKRVD